jgi:hypothetical protein
MNNFLNNLMEVDNPFGSNPSNKRSFVEALKEFTQTQTTPPAKRQTVDPTATDTIRIEVNKVPTKNSFVSQNLRVH